MDIRDRGTPSSQGFVTAGRPRPTVEILRLVGSNGENDNWIYVFDAEGRLQRRFPQFAQSQWGMRDLAWDGELLWGADGRIIYGFTVEGELQQQFEGPLEVNRSLVWDPDLQLLWISDLNSDIFGVTRDGEVVQIIRNPALRMYGLAWDDQGEDGFNLLIFVDVDGHPLSLYRLNPDTGELQGANLMLLSLLDEGRAGGGLAVTSDWNPPLRHVLGTVDGESDAVGVWQLSSYYGGGELVIAGESSLEIGVEYRPQEEGESAGELAIQSGERGVCGGVFPKMGSRHLVLNPFWTYI